MLKATQAVIEFVIRSIKPPPPALELAICSPHVSPASTYAQSILNDFRIVFGVPKYRTPKPRIAKRRFGYTRLLHPEENLVTCKGCGFSHHVTTICGVCYEKVRDVTNAIKREMMKYNPYLNERQDKQIVVKFEGEPEIQTKPSQRVVEVPRDRPSCKSILLYPPQMWWNHSSGNDLDSPVVSDFIERLRLLPSDYAMPHSQEVSRRIRIYTPHQDTKFCSNEISTCKYNAISFLPRFLLEQFRRYSNIFFLVIALLQQIPDVSPTGRYNTAVPFLIIMSVSALKEIFEDIKRRRMDYLVNNYMTTVLKNGKWTEIEWKNVQVGDIVKISDGHVFPADIVLLSSSEPHGIAYIETSSLDGETNLKIRQAPKISVEYNTKEKLGLMNAEVECEGPNKDVGSFAGTLIIGNIKYALKSNELLLRGARLKNTRWIYGAVIYTGHDAKLLKNSKTAPLKKSTIDMITNNRIIFLFFVLVALALICGGGAEIYDEFFLTNAWYLGKIGDANFAWNVLTFFILYNNLIPISLQVTLELVRFFQASYINNDIQMYDEESDTAANARTSNLNEELGQVEYIMTDKTGTLTRNVMKFKRCSVLGVNYGDDTNESFVDERLIKNMQEDQTTEAVISHFLTLMAICHTVVPEEKEDGKLLYQGSSPDEAALVEAASTMGIIFEAREPDHLVVNKLGTRMKFELLHTLEFNSDRKRMSVIVKSDEGYVLYSKGADNIIMERLRPRQEKFVSVADQHLREYAHNGYRTLCFAYRPLNENTYQNWSERYMKATTAVPKDEGLIAKLEEEMERDMTFLGATAIEDKLQIYVPETIVSLKAAGIKIWMLTGDKKETAINIAQSSALIDDDTQIFIIQTGGDLYNVKPGGNENYAIVINGNAVKDIIANESREFVDNIILRSHSVVCYRMTPSQKAEIVEMVQKASKGVVLAIGDGANDVAMIQAANVGIGITGEEGLRAASSSDYSIAQFHFLRRLLLVHGAWNHDRTVKVILYSFYKNICLYIIELWFAFFSAFSGQTIFDRWTIAFFNLVFTAFPPIMIGLFDHPVSARTMLENPHLYRSFQERSFSNKIFGLWVALAIWHSLLLFFLTYAIMQQSVLWQSGHVGGWLMLGCSAYTYVVVTVCLKALLEADTWTWILIFFCIGSIISWFVFMMIYSVTWPWIPIGADMCGMAWIMMSSYTFWLGLLFVPITTLFSDYIIKSLQTSLFPTPRDLMIRKEKSMKQQNVHEIIVNKDDVSFELDDDPVINPSSSTISPPNAEQTQLHYENQALIDSPLSSIINGAYTNPGIVEDIELGTANHSAKFQRSAFVDSPV
uniref:Phospholipid-transporting ATPase n=1 Tax=Panagrolaimus sp. JU765 TaxID=591449 RepID=A0AC34QJV5_9BILA